MHACATLLFNVLCVWACVRRRYFEVMTSTAENRKLYAREDADADGFITWDEFRGE